MLIHFGRERELGKRERERKRKRGRGEGETCFLLVLGGFFVRPCISYKLVGALTV